MKSAKFLIVLAISLVAVSLFVGYLAGAETALAGEGEPVVLDWSTSGSSSGGQVAETADAPVNLQIDDGSKENDVGLQAGGQFIWANRFTPDPADFPFCLNEVDVLFGAGVGADVGEIIDIYVYADPDDNPANGATLVGSLTGQTVQANDDVTFSTYPTGGFNMTGPGGVLIAVVNRTAATAPGEFPAAIDQTASQMRSWIGLYGGNPPDPPTLPAPTWGIVDVLTGGAITGNWMVRGLGETGACPVQSIDIDKSPATQDVVTNGNAYFTITVTNTGDVDLNNVTVSDPLVSDCDNNIGTLTVGASNSYACTDTGVAASYTNVVTVTSTIGTAPGPADSASAVVNSVPPTSVSLSGFGGEAGTFSPVWLVALLAVVLSLGFVVRRKLTA